MKKKNIALVAHDNRKKDLIDWVKLNHEKLTKHKLICTGTTGILVEKVILETHRDFNKNRNEIIKLINQYESVMELSERKEDSLNILSKLEIASDQPAAAAVEDRLAVMYFENFAEPDDPRRLGEIAANLLIEFSDCSLVSVFFFF